jgi:transposase InsO family protein/transposase-like protein
MTTYGYILPKAGLLLRLNTNLSLKAKHRLKVIDWHRANGENQSLTSRHFGVGREALREWLKRFKERGIKGLEDKSHRPHKVRERKIPLATQDEIVKLRKLNPCYSKYKISVLLGSKVSPSSVGRVLKDKGLVNHKVSARRSKSAKYPKHRFPRDIVINYPGKLLQIDTKHLTVYRGRKFYQFTAIDVLTKLRVLWVTTHISSAAAKKFLKLCLKEFPFNIENIQTDNGSEFHKHFDEFCKQLTIPHYYTEAYSPKQNSYVERSHLTDELEFYQQGNMRTTAELLLPLIKAWERKYNHERPHQSLNYLTPMKYFQKFERQGISTKEYIPLQT